MAKINLGSIIRDEQTIEVDLSMMGADETLSIVYRPSAYTPEAEARFVQADKSDIRSEAAVDLLHTTLVSWELEDDGRPVGTEPDDLRKLPLLLLSCVIEEIAADMAGKVGAQPAAN